jgi:hypothetical protein
MVTPILLTSIYGLRMMMARHSPILKLASNSSIGLYRSRIYYSKSYLYMLQSKNYPGWLKQFNGHAAYAIGSQI